MLERPLSHEPVPKFAQRTPRILINEKRESRQHLKDLSNCTQITTVLPHRPMTPISDTKNHFRIHVSKTGYFPFSSVQLRLRFRYSCLICYYQVTEFSSRGTASPVRFLQGALAISVLLQISKFLLFWAESRNTVHPGCHTRGTIRI